MYSTLETPISLNLTECNLSQSFVENEIKELKKKKFLAEIEIEKKMEIFEKLNDENHNLQLKNKNLRKKLKETNKPDRVEYTEGQVVTQKINTNYNLDQFEHPEIENLKEELEDAQLTLKSKKKILIEVKKKIKITYEKLEDSLKHLEETQNNKNILQQELLILEADYKNLQTKQNKYHGINKISENSTKLQILIQDMDKVLIDKKNIETSLIKIREENELSSSIIKKLDENLKNTLSEIEKNQTLYASLILENFRIKNKIKEINDFTRKYEEFTKELNNELNRIKSAIKENKIMLEKIELDMTNKLYFIRYSNSLVRTLFNIINTRRLQIEMCKNFEKEEKSVYDMMFKKLDDLENALVKEYGEYMLLISE